MYMFNTAFENMPCTMYIVYLHAYICTFSPLTLQVKWCLSHVLCSCTVYMYMYNVCAYHVLLFVRPLPATELCLCLSTTGTVGRLGVEGDGMSQVSPTSPAQLDPFYSQG